MCDEVARPRSDARPFFQVGAHIYIFNVGKMGGYKMNGERDTVGRAWPRSSNYGSRKLTVARDWRRRCRKASIKSKRGGSNRCVRYILYPGIIFDFLKVWK